MRIKGGQTLVEVVVALGILAVVFAGTVTLIVQVVNLGLSARNRTEAVAITQKYLSKNILAIESGCLKDLSTPIEDEEADDGYDVAPTILYVEDNLVDNAPEGEKTSFVRVTITTEWKNKGFSTPEKYEISQIVRAN